MLPPKPSAAPVACEGGPYPQAGSYRISNLSPWFVASASVIILVSAGITAYSTSFARFSGYDDEGFLMMSVHGFLRGHPLYSAVLTPYGPFYYFYEWTIHTVARIPLAHDTTRALCLVHWLLAASLLALAGARITRSALAGIFIFIQAVPHLLSLAHEPGHPQELIALLLALAALVASSDLEQTATLAILGGIGAAATFTKINIGAFFGIALALAICCREPWFRARTACFWALLALVSALPFLLMRHQLAQNWVRFYAAGECAAILACGAAAYTFSDHVRVGLRGALQAGGAFFGVSLVFLLILVLTGTSLPSIAQNLISAPAQLDTVVWAPNRVLHSWRWGLSALLVAAAALRLRSQSVAWRLLIGSAKALYGFAGAVVLVSRYYHYEEALDCLLPWIWLVLVPTGCGNREPNQGSFARTFICLQAVWQGLQAYPVPGTQTAIGTFLPVLAYTICINDAIIMLVNEP